MVLFVLPCLVWRTWCMWLDPHLKGLQDHLLSLPKGDVPWHIHVQFCPLGGLGYRVSWRHAIGWLISSLLQPAPTDSTLVLFSPSLSTSDFSGQGAHALPLELVPLQAPWNPLGYDWCCCSLTVSVPRNSNTEVGCSVFFPPPLSPSIRFEDLQLHRESTQGLLVPRRSPAALQQCGPAPWAECGQGRVAVTVAPLTGMAGR